MGIFSGMFRPQAVSPTLEKLILEHFGGGSTASGLSVTADSAMRLLTVHNCIKVLYNCMSQMPFHLMEEVDGIKNKAKDHPLYHVIGKRPNRWMTAAEFWGLAEVHVASRGNFLAFKTKATSGQVRELLPVNPDRVRSITQNPDWSITYKIAGADGAEAKDYTQDQIFHIRGMSLNGYSGLNPIEYARESIGLGLASEKFLSRYFGRGVHPSAVITNPHQLDAKTHANMKAVLKQKYEGLGGSESQGFMFLDDGMQVTFPPIKLVDAQFLELGKFNEAQICGMFGVPLMLVQAGDNPTTFASATEFKRAFVDLVIAPKAVNFGESIDRDCLTEDERKRYYTKGNLSSLLRGNIIERFKAYSMGIDKEILNPNEVRALEDMNAYDGGDVYKTRTSTTRESGESAGQGEM